MLSTEHRSMNPRSVTGRFGALARSFGVLIPAGRRYRKWLRLPLADQLLIEQILYYHEEARVLAYLERRYVAVPQPLKEIERALTYAHERGFWYVSPGALECTNCSKVYFRAGHAENHRCLTEAANGVLSGASPSLTGLASKRTRRVASGNATSATLAYPTVDERKVGSGRAKSVSNVRLAPTGARAVISDAAENFNAGTQATNVA